MRIQSSIQEEMVLEDPLVQEGGDEYTGDFSVDIHGRPALKNSTGNWSACCFILGAEFSERFANTGIGANLISYLSNTLHLGSLSAATSVSTWQGTCFLTPLLGAFLADARWGRYFTILVFSAIYLVGMCALTLSAWIPDFKHVVCNGSSCSSASAQYGVSFFGLYLVALGTGGIKPCVSPFGADQFDDTNPKERAAKGSFFNWHYFSFASGTLLSQIVVVWIQENLGWGIGFGIPTLFMAIAIASFLLGTPSYRFHTPRGSPFTRMCQVVVASLRKWKLDIPQDHLLYEITDENSTKSRKLKHTSGLRWLDKAAILTDEEIGSGLCHNPWRLCTVTQVEELKSLLRMFPIWATSIPYYIVYSQVNNICSTRNNYAENYWTFLYSSSFPRIYFYDYWNIMGPHL